MVQKGWAMVLRSLCKVVMYLSTILWLAALPAAAQAPAPNKVVHVNGLVAVKSKTNGLLTLENGNLQFTSSNAKASVPIHSVEDVITENDSQRVFRGTIGTLTMLAP